MDAPPESAEPDPAFEAFRIQVAAVVAQQAALTEQEIRVADRESALTRQEEQLAIRLEEDRRQLLDLQDQITNARAALRQKRAAHAEMVEHAEHELNRARAEAAELLSAAKAERHRLLHLQSRLRQRLRKHWQVQRQQIGNQENDLQRESDSVAAERAALAVERQRFHSEAELEKRRLMDERTRLAGERRIWQADRIHGEASRREELRDLAHRAKRVAAAESHLAAERVAHERAISDRRREIVFLETRVANARRILLEHQSDLPRSESVPVPLEILTNPERTEDSQHLTSAVLSDDAAKLAKRRETLDRIAAELADQRIQLAEQAERLMLTLQSWCAERAEVQRDLEGTGIQLQRREEDLDRRDQELVTAHSHFQSEFEALGALRLRLEMEHVWIEARDADRRAGLDSWQASLASRERVLVQREAGLMDLYQLWGRRRRRETQRLRSEQDACRAERAEWAAAREIWLRANETLRDERRTVAAQALAVEQLRQTCLNAAESPALAAKRLERLRRQWATYCNSTATSLERLQATLEVEAVRLDERSQRVRDEQVAALGEANSLSDRTADLERAELLREVEQAEMVEHRARERLARELADRRSAELRDQIENMARLLIDAPKGKSESQAA